MNDRFKFRVWNGAKYYCENNFILPSGELGFFVESMGYPYYRIFSKQENFTIEQCTGLKDKNGKLIYEGDILVFVKGATHPIAVTWNGIGWKFIRNGKRIEDAFECNIMSHISSCEIIGNIHDKEKA